MLNYNKKPKLFDLGFLFTHTHLLVANNFVVNANGNR